MAFQFLHVSTYARERPKKAAKGKDRKWTVRDIAGEVERDPGHSPHVQKPLEPKLVFGMKAREAVKVAEDRAASSTDVSGRKVRKDTPVLLAGVASHPYTVDELADPKANRDYEQWKRDTLKWLQAKYGDNLLSVVEHKDEAHPHLHFYAVPDAGKGFNAKSLHDGFKAGAEAKTPPEQQRLYCEGMRGLQDDFFKQVGAKYGHARLGPQRRRLKRSEWLQEQKQLQLLSGLIRGAKTTMAKARREATAIIEKSRAEAQSVGTRLTSFLGGMAGRAGDALKRLERERDEEKAKREAETEGRQKAEKEAEEVRAKLVHARLSGDDTVKNLVRMKTLPLEKRLEAEQKMNEELKLQLEDLSIENLGLRQQLKGPGAQGPSMGRKG